MLKIYEDNEIPDRPTDEEFGEAISLVLAQVMHLGGAIDGVVFRHPMPGAEGRSFEFHFEIHDARLCNHSADHGVKLLEGAQNALSTVTKQ